MSRYSYSHCFLFRLSTLLSLRLLNKLQPHRSISPPLNNHSAAPSLILSEELKNEDYASRHSRRRRLGRTDYLPRRQGEVRTSGAHVVRPERPARRHEPPRRAPVCRASTEQGQLVGVRTVSAGLGSWSLVVRNMEEGRMHLGGGSQI